MRRLNELINRKMGVHACYENSMIGRFGAKS